MRQIFLLISDILVCLVSIL
ncbi:hypothetical protein LINPERPRIM_LOCUS13860 [Linum perenne]